MKLKKNDIHITEKMELKYGNSFIERVEILYDEFYIYYEMLKGDGDYKVYSISERTYKKAISGVKVDVQNEQYLGNMSREKDELIWIAEMQNKTKAFGGIGASKKNKGGNIIVCITLIGLVLMIFGVWKEFNNKQILGRMEVTEGEVTGVSTHRLMGKRYAEGYYDIYVKYTIDGKNYEGYNGSTMNKMRVGEKIKVRYDSKKPENIIIEEDMKKYTFLFLYVGAIMTVVGVTLLISEIKHRKKK